MLLRVTFAALLCSSSAVLAEETLPAKLAGFAVIPANTMIAPPADAPRDAWISGKFTGDGRNDTPMSVPGDTGPAFGSHPTGLSLPFLGQPFQGMSGFAMNRAEDGSIFTLADNGFGSKGNSPDALLVFHRLLPDFETGKVERLESVFLHDPDHKVPFRIAYEGTDGRYLTGADFDPESIQLLDDTIWIGDEFGPYLIEATTDGRVLNVHPTMLEGERLKGPDTPGVTVPAVAGKDYRVQRSGGYEGMALHPRTNELWAMLEKPLLTEDGTEGDFLRVLVFDPAERKWTGDTHRFRLAEGAVAIGDFNFIDDHRALVIERDAGEGMAACEDGADPAACYPRPARVKNIVLVDTADTDEDGFMRRIGHVDLLDIQDPDGLSPHSQDGVFTFPFQTIEDVIRMDDTHILVADDNNLPFSGGREIGQAADNEFILLDVADLLAAE
ncbi:esterase-like activity of phytase family protein [Falsirhodobacter deserti]|uniref:esterase-like activity of phytase family protein n=1 Tax=Falsirhodobacter deserti TaxID=1365611 RepID=UPI000FE3568E|nr:esterase-like activity of phytase family protein [Falsirhodobacter deserti]